VQRAIHPANHRGDRAAIGRSIEAQTARAEVHDHDRRLRIPMVKAWNEIRPVVRSILCK